MQERAALIQKALELDRLASQSDLSVKSLDGSFGISKKNFLQQEPMNNGKRCFWFVILIQQTVEMQKHPLDNITKKNIHIYIF